MDAIAIATRNKKLLGVLLEITDVVTIEEIEVAVKARAQAAAQAIEDVWVGRRSKTWEDVWGRHGAPMSTHENDLDHVVGGEVEEVIY